jgi:hypothetical protein
VRIGRLRTARDYGPLGVAPPAQEQRVYLRAQHLASQRLALPAQDVAPANLRLPQHRDGAGAGLLDGPLGLFDEGNLCLRLCAAHAGEEPGVGGDRQAAGAQLVGVEDAEVWGDGDGGAGGPELLEHVRRRRRQRPAAAL